MKKVTITALVPDDTNQNDLKTWVKGCPFSLAGDQTVTWENIPEPAKEEAQTEAANDGANAPANAEAANG